MIFLNFCFDHSVFLPTEIHYVSRHSREMTLPCCFAAWQFYLYLAAWMYFFVFCFFHSQWCDPCCCWCGLRPHFFVWRKSLNWIFILLPLCLPTFRPMTIYYYCLVYLQGFLSWGEMLEPCFELLLCLSATSLSWCGKPFSVFAHQESYWFWPCL